MSADTPEELRASAGDFSLMFEKNSAAAHLIDTPTGLYEVDPFDKCAVLALWKFAAAKEAFELGGTSHTAIGLAMECMTCAHLALSIGDSDRELAREMHHPVKARRELCTLCRHSPLWSIKPIKA